MQPIGRELLNESLWNLTHFRIAFSLRIAAGCLLSNGGRLTARDFDGSLVHLRVVYLLQLSKLCRAGVFAGLDSQSESETPQTHPPCAGGFLVLVQINARKHRWRSG